MKSLNHVRGLWRFYISRDCPSACRELNPAQDYTTSLGAVGTILWLIPMTRKGCNGLRVRADLSVQMTKAKAQSATTRCGTELVYAAVQREKH